MKIMIRSLLDGLRRLREQNLVVRQLLGPVLWCRRFWYWYILSDRCVIRQRYKSAFGNYPDLKKPKKLNEIIQWLKLNDRTPLHTKCADKYAVREYVKEKVDDKYLIPLHFCSENPGDVVPEKFPDEPFIIKTNHDSEGGHIVYVRQSADWANIRKDLIRRLKHNYYYQSREWQYKNITPCIIAEKLLINTDGSIPFDYKLHCFNGRAEFIGLDIDRFLDHKRNFYDRDWKLMPFVWSAADRDQNPLWPNGRAVERPACLKEIIEVAESLAKPFAYCRVDLYVVNEKIFFGEITFHHGGGSEVFFPSSWDKTFGEMIDLPEY